MTLVAISSAQAKPIINCENPSKCPDPALVDQAFAQVEAACPCGTASSPKKYKICWRPVINAIREDLGKQVFTKACEREVVYALNASICGRPQFVLCRKFKGNGDETCSVVKPNKCDDPYPPSSVCGAFVNCSQACNADDCTTTTSTTLASTTSSTSTTLVSTTSTTLVSTTSTTVASTTSTTAVSTTSTSVTSTTSTSVEPSSTTTSTSLPTTTSTTVATTTSTSTTIVASTTSTTIPPPTTTSTTVPPTTTSTTVPPTSTSTTVVTTTSTTTSTAPSGPVPLRFTTAPAGGTCGESRDGGPTGTILNNLTCGGLNIGGGSATVPEGPTPAGADTFFTATCAAGSCTISARTAAETGSNTNCSDTGCSFGPPLSISNGGLSTCVLNTFASPATGTVTTPGGVYAGGVPLTSNVTVTGNGANPCPSCVASVCDGTASNAGAACTAINAVGDAYECLPSGVALAPFGVNLTPIGTGTAVANNATGTFCAGQDASPPGENGCFGDDTCDYIEERGADAAGLTDGAGQVAGRLASVFCIPATGNGLIDGAADLPGPGAVTLPGQFELN